MKNQPVWKVNTEMECQTKLPNVMKYLSYLVTYHSKTRPIGSAFQDIAKELGITVPRSTLEHNFYDYHDIFKRKATFKSSLTTDPMETRLAFSYMALSVALQNVGFPDEMWVEFNLIRRAYNISEKHGEDPNQWTIYHKEVSIIWVMFWEAICSGQRGPYNLWVQDTEEEKREYLVIIDTENQICHGQ